MRNIGGDLYGPGLRGALGIVLWRKLLKLRKECLARAARFERSRLGDVGIVLTLHSVGRNHDTAPQKIAYVVRLRSVFRQQIVEQNNIARHLRDLSALRVVGALCRADQQAEDKRGYRPDEASAPSLTTSLSSLLR